MRISAWLTALLLILAVSAAGLATTASAAGPQATAAKKKGCKKGYVKKKTAKGTKCVKKAAKKKGATKPKTGNAKLPADGTYALSVGQLYVSDGQKTAGVRASVPASAMTCAPSGQPAGSGAAIALLGLAIHADGTFSGGGDTGSGPAEVSGHFTSATRVELTLTATGRTISVGGVGDLCSGSTTITATLSVR